jgi:hypothetical protein
MGGNGQTHPRVMTSSGIATAKFDAMTVQLRDSQGEPLAGEKVSWSTPPSAMAVQMEPSGASPCITVTDSNGVATLNKMAGKSIEAYYADGGFTVTASYGEASQTFEGTVGGEAPEGVTVSIVSGDHQSVPRTGLDIPGGRASFAPLQVKVVDTAGQPVSGATIGFAVGSNPAGMAVQMHPLYGGGLRVVTDGSGIATLNQMGGNSMTCYYAMGNFTITATPDGGNQVSFSLNVSE